MASDKRNPSRHTEVERKFAPADSAVPPSFEGLAAISRVERLPEQHLDAVYFDTAGHDLAANRITLRRRTGGPDAGWHLKLPSGPDARTEVRLPLEAGTAGVPAELRDIVLAIVRDRPLNEVARIETTRSVDLLHGPGGGAVAEFCDDRVTASTPTGETSAWREWELELVEADGSDDPSSSKALLERLANRLLDAGAEPAGHGSKLARVLSTEGAEKDAAAPRDPVHRAVAEQVAELLVWDRAVRADAWDSVHQLRVVTRKIRSLLRSSEASFGIDDDAWILEELKLFAGVLGVARDAEVLAEKYETSLDALPAELVRGPVRERLVDGAKKRYHAGWKRSLAAMRSERYFRLLDGLDELVAAEPAPLPSGAEPETPTVEAAYKRLRKAAKRAEAAAADETVSPEEADEALHKIRKRAKQLRYTAAALGEGAVADGAKTIQSLLGDHQDSVVSRVQLAQESRAAHDAGEDTFTYGVLFEREAAVARHAEEQLADALKALKKAARA